MLHLLLIAMVASMFATDALGDAVRVPGLPLAVGAWITVGVHGVLAVSALGWGKHCARALGSTGKGVWIARAQRGASAARIGAACVHVVAVLSLGWLDAVRAVMGDWVLLDEAVALLPAIGVFFASWASFGAIERMLREATLVRTLDEGRPVHRPRGAWSYAADQFRHGAAIVLVPLAIIWSWSEALAWGAERLGWSLESDGAQAMLAAAQLLGVLVAFVATPPLMMRVWRTVPLGPGEVRDRIWALCVRHRVRCRDIRVWRTDGAMINGAVMGLFAPVRYILLTDALLESLPEAQVEAVTAHEIAHMRRRHLPWLLGAMLGAIWLGDAIVLLPFDAVESALRVDLRGTAVEWAAQAMGVAASIVLAALAFGVVSRTFERQADAFAAQSLSGLDTPRERDGRIEEAATRAMSGALSAVARLNAIPAQRFFWRHGSIDGRRRRIRALTGTPVRRTPADRAAGRVKAATAATLALMVCVEGWFAILPMFR